MPIESPYLEDGENSPDTTHDTDVDPRENFTQGVALGFRVTRGKEVAQAFGLGGRMTCCRDNYPRSSNRESCRSSEGVQGDISSVEDWLFLVTEVNGEIDLPRDRFLPLLHR